MLKYKRVLISVVMLVCSFLIIQAYEKEFFNLQPVSSKDYDRNNIKVERDKYILRNFMWSGILPIYGGFMPDPHILYSKPVDVTDYLSAVFQNKNVRYQLIDVNPFFGNKTSEHILAMEIDGMPYEYRMKTPPGSRLATLQHNEPDSVFLYNEDTLYFILEYDYWEGEFLIYEINYPFTENKDLDYHFIGNNESDVPAFLEYSLSQDQMDQLLKHHHSLFYSFYTQYLNEDYAFNQVDSVNGEELNITAYYGAQLNINYNKTKSIVDEEFSLKVHNRYEFITSMQNMKVSNSPDTKKLMIELLHSNYYDLLFLGDSFETSDFAIRNETKFILIEYDYIDRLLSYIDQYKKIRADEPSSVVYFQGMTPFLVEIITQYSDELTIDRKGISILIIPPNQSPQTERTFKNRTDYALPQHDLHEDYFFTMDFNDGYSLKLSYNEVLQFEQFLKSNN